MLAVLAAIALVGVGGCLAAWIREPTTAITGTNAARIQPGMTLADVEAILGGPPRDEADQSRFRPDEFDERNSEQERKVESGLWRGSRNRDRRWMSSAAVVLVLFSEN